MSAAARPASPTSRASDPNGDPAPGRRERGDRGGQMGLCRGARVGAGLGRVQAGSRAPGRGGGQARSLGARRHLPLRARGAGAHRRARHRALRDRRPARPARPDARLRAARSRPAAGRGRGPDDARRLHRGQPLRPPPLQGGRGARPLPRGARGLRPRRAFQVGRAGGQERHRLRPLQAARGLLGDARGDDRDHDQGPARCGEAADGAGLRARRRGRDRGDDARARRAI